MNWDCACWQNALANNEPIRLNDELALHLADCAACAVALAERQGVTAVVRRALANDGVAPAALRRRIRQQLHQPPSLWQRIVAWFDDLNNGWAVAFATALLLVTVGVATVTYRKASSPANELARVNFASADLVGNARVLKVGLGHHQHCAVERDYSSGPLSFAQMAEDVNSEWVDLIPLVTSHIPADYSVMMAHRCQFEGREFIHLIMSNHRTVVSLALTHKNGEAFDAPTALAQMRDGNYSVAGFETQRYLGYVVSGLDVQQNLQLAIRIAPFVREFVARREG